MNYRAIIRDSWRITQENKKIIWWFGFLPAIFTSIFSMVYIGYQVLAFWFWMDPSVAGTESFFGWMFKHILEFFNDNPGPATFLIILSAIFAVFYFILPVFTQGALIQILARMRKGIPVNVMQGFSFGFTRFLQLFEFHLFIRTFSIVGILSEGAFVLRNLGTDAFAIFGWIILFMLLIGLFLTLLFTYSEFYIVIDNEGVFKSMLRSSGLVVRQWHHTLFMLLLMALISLRILINIVVALLIPTVVILPIFLFASLTLTILGVIVGSIIGLIALYFSAYFIGIFHIFATGVWTFTFLELTSEQEVDLRA